MLKGTQLQLSNLSVAVEFQLIASSVIVVVVVLLSHNVFFPEVILCVIFPENTHASRRE
jgi:hypothetical protein